MASNSIKRDHHLWTKDTIKNVSGDVTLDISGDITLKPTGGELYIHDGSNNIFTLSSSACRFQISDDANIADYLRIDVAAEGATTISTVDADTAVAHLTFNTDGNIILGCNPGGEITLQENDGSPYSPTASTDATTKKYVDTYVNSPSIPFFFNETTTSRTYFRNADDAFNAWEWDSYDTEDSTSVDATITLSASNLLAGYVVGHACTLVGATWNTYQGNAVSGVAHFQLWTADPSTGSTTTLRTTNQLTSNRVHATTSTTTIDIDLAKGDVVIPGIQYISGTSTVWYGGVTLLFKRTV